MSRVHRHPRKTQLTFDVLEDRTVPTCSISETNGTLLIVGDNSNDGVLLNDNGTRTLNGQTTSDIFVTCGTKSYDTHSLITDIRVITNGGADQVLYNLNVALTMGQGRRLFVDLGAGNDFFGASFADSLQPNTNMQIVAKGGSGRDRLSVDAGAVFIPDTATLNVNLQGGDDQDIVNLNFSGVVSGFVFLHADAGAGFDAINNNVTALPGSDGLLKTDVRGGPGPDRVRMFVRKSLTTDSGRIPATLDLAPMRISSW